jgi:hypothetical protein
MGTEQKIKIITYIDRSNILSDIFIKYYLNFFKLEEFHFLILDSQFDLVSNYLLSNNFTSENFKSVSNNYFGTADEILKTQNETLNEFIKKGYIVVYVDIDEIIYHHDLRNYILNNINDYITPSGIVLIPSLDEGHLDHNDKILNQRKYCIFDNKWHSKTCILNKKYTWSAGRHNKNLNNISEDIFLIDIGRSCPEIIRKNNELTRKIYKNVSFKYSTDQKYYIDSMISKFLPSLKPLPDYILNTKLF